MIMMWSASTRSGDAVRVPAPGCGGTTPSLGALLASRAGSARGAEVVRF